MTIWKPDTCDCEVEYSDDGNFTLIAVRNKCAKHASVALANHLTTLLAHNRKKNNVVNWLVATHKLTPDPITGTLPFSANFNFAAAMANDPVVVTGVGAALAARASATTVAQVRSTASTQFGGATVVNIVN